MHLLALQTGQLVNLNEMANTLAVSRDTLSRHLSYLENTFMVRILRPFVGNRRGELTKMPKIYFADPGIRNLLAGRLTSGLTQADRGPLLENLVEILLRLDSRTEGLFFWRTSSGAEIDFVWQAGGELYAVEVKAAALTRPTITRALGSFLKTYRPRRAAVVNMGLCTQIEREETRVLFLTPDRLASLPEDEPLLPD
jgi:predicted AAA+ superfamily ATPase